MLLSTTIDSRDNKPPNYVSYGGLMSLYELEYSPTVKDKICATQRWYKLEKIIALTMSKRVSAKLSLYLMMNFVEWFAL